MTDSESVCHTADDGSTYAVEVVPPEQDDYGAQYGVDLVRASTDRYGLEHEQRLRLGAYPSSGSAEEHQREVETALEKDGLDGLGEDARRVAQMPYLDGQYLAVVFPIDGSAGEGAKVHLLHLTGQQVTAALVANGRREDMETLCEGLDRAWAEGGNERLLDTAQREAELRGQIAPTTPLFEAAPTLSPTDDLFFTFDDDTDRQQAMERDMQPDQTQQDPEPTGHYWQMQHRPAQTPDGQPLGVALFVTEFPDLPPDFDTQVERDGMNDSLYPSRARTVEMAHFADAAQARQFETEFRSYLVPGLIDGPELAPEVAKLEGLSGAWQDLTEREVIESMEPNRAVVRDPSDWHPYNPNAEREARIAAEGVYYDPIQNAFKRDEPEIEADSPELDF